MDHADCRLGASNQNVNVQLNSKFPKQLQSYLRLRTSTISLILQHWPVTALSNCSSIIVNALSITVLASGACENVLTKDLETQDGHTFCWSGSISQCIASPDTVLSIFSSLTLWLFAKDFDNTRWTHILMQWANKSMLSQSIHSVAHLLLFKSMVVFTQILVTYYTSTSQPPFQLHISSGTYTVL